MPGTLLAFCGVAAVVTLTPGPATALVVRSALRGGRRSALRTTFGNATGILLWALASALGISALVAASEAAFAVLKIAGAITLVALGVESFRRARRGEAPPEDTGPSEPGSAYRVGLVTGLANPKLAVFFIALFPQFVPHGYPVLPSALAMALIIIGCDLVYFSLLAVVVTRAKRAFVQGPWARRMERISGTVLIALGLRLAVEPR
jgi:threonine/homoserine/homoserine lactone efflux protein